MIGFDWVRQSNTIKLLHKNWSNQTQSNFDWVWLGSVAEVGIHSIKNDNSYINLQATSIYCSFRLILCCSCMLKKTSKFLSILKDGLHCLIKFDWVRKSNAIELTQFFRSIVFDYQTQSNPIVRLSSVIEHNQTLTQFFWFNCVRLPNSIESNSSIEFGNWTQSNSHTIFLVQLCSITELNQTQSFDWVRLSSITEQFVWVVCRVH